MELTYDEVDTMDSRKCMQLCVVGLLAFVSTGCATNSEVRRVREQAQNAQRIADQALIVAQEANTRSLRTEDMVDRSFRHTMRK